MGSFLPVNKQIATMAAGIGKSLDTESQTLANRDLSDRANRFGRSPT
jgi:hypothetical protein